MYSAPFLIMVALRPLRSAGGEALSAKPEANGAPGQPGNCAVRSALYGSEFRGRPMNGDLLLDDPDDGRDRKIGGRGLDRDQLCQQAEDALGRRRVLRHA